MPSARVEPDGRPSTTSRNIPASTSSPPACASEAGMLISSTSVPWCSITVIASSHQSNLIVPS